MTHFTQNCEHCGTPLWKATDSVVIGCHKGCKACKKFTVVRLVKEPESLTGTDAQERAVELEADLEHVWDTAGSSTSETTAEAVRLIARDFEGYGTRRASDALHPVRMALYEAGYCADGNVAQLVTQALKEAKEKPSSELRRLHETLDAVAGVVHERTHGTLAERVQLTIGRRLEEERRRFSKLCKRWEEDPCGDGGGLSPNGQSSHARYLELAATIHYADHSEKLPDVPPQHGLYCMHCGEVMPFGAARPDCPARNDGTIQMPCEPNTEV